MKNSYCQHFPNKISKNGTEVQIHDNHKENIYVPYYPIRVYLCTGEVKEGTDVQTGYTAYTDHEGRKCGLRIDTVKESDLGKLCFW